MRSNYAHLILLDLVIYETHRSGYDPVKNVQDFWDKYPLSTIKDYIVVLHPNTVDNEKMSGNPQLSEFSVELLRVLIAYFMIHMTQLDLGKVSISIEVNKEAIDTSKAISDFFQRVSPSKTNP
ncbi:hypothetical protein [Sphingobacterium sp. UGAL515B_05]|uniref:hypothetical protein n=1 Tax=Sphingobacterium sp. UGAL515B_05 TaxID=2986767 RepID=UPI0029547106|nr:hypothetical protein [Sphingobacterium sp. UGAL515B_05]WON92530.1 hypothetical protein OK025_14925 [Sphingobacterium sp. UGAL515B_05]